MSRSVVVSAGLLRVFGQEVAELPIVATSREHQGKVCILRFKICSCLSDNTLLFSHSMRKSGFVKVEPHYFKFVF